MNLFDVAGKHIVVTGASSGLGHHFAGMLANAGAQLSLGARRLQRIEQRVAEIQAAGGSAFGSPLDVTEAASIQDFLQAAEAAFGPIDVLINNAGVEAGAKTYAMIDEADWDYVLNTNLKGAWLAAKLYTDRVLRNGQAAGNIINISSITDRRTIKGQFPYAVSKAALSRMTEVMALEAAKHNIRVNALAPGYVLTDVSRLLLEGEHSAQFVKGIPMRRYGAFADLDGPLLLLASNASSYMTGAILVVDGGHACASL